MNIFALCRKHTAVQFQSDFVLCSCILKTTVPKQVTPILKSRNIFEDKKIIGKNIKMNIKVLILVIALLSQTYAGPVGAGICYAG